MESFVFSKRLRGRPAEADDRLRRDHIELAEQIRRAGRDFVVLGLAIFRRAAFHDVADVNVFARAGPWPRSSASEIFRRGRQTAILECLHRGRGLRRQRQVRRADFPAPKTILLRCLCRRQRVHSPRSSRMRSSVSPSTRSTASNNDDAFTTGSTATGGAVLRHDRRSADGASRSRLRRGSAQASRQARFAAAVLIGRFPMVLRSV